MLGHFAPAQYDLFAGLDVDKNSIAITFMDHQQVVKSLKIPAHSDQLLSYVRRHYPGQRVAFAYEAGGTGFRLYDELTAQGYSCLVVCPSLVPTSPGQRVKTNRLDSHKLSLALRGGQLKGVHVPNEPYRHLRHLNQLRDTSVRQTIAFKNRIKALLLYEGLPFPGASGQWSKAVIAQLRELPCAPAVRFKIDQLIESLVFHHRQSIQTQKEIHRFCKEHAPFLRDIQLLMSLPGIGWITGSHLLARIGDWRLLHNSNQIPAFLGLVPREHSTGDTIHKGSITRLGDARLRSKMIQSAWVAVRQDPELHQFYHRIRQRHPHQHAAQKAIVAVARKLASRILTILKEQRPYRPLQNSFTAEKLSAPEDRLDVVAESE